MLPQLVEATYLGGYRVWLRFADGMQGEADLSHDLWGEIFEPLRDVEAFARLTVDPALGTVVWPNGADLAPEYLYDKLSHRGQ
jgi:hypothetical protein